MAFKFVVAVLAIFVVAQANAGCLLPPGLLAALGGLAPPPPALAPPALAPPALALPASLPCPPVPTKLTQKPDINIPLPLPAEIPLGNFCSCQKYGITPTLLPCAPSAPAPAPLPLPAPAPVAYLPAPAPAPVTYLPAPAPAPGLSLSPCLLKALLAGLPKPAPPALPCGCA